MLTTHFRVWHIFWTKGSKKACWLLVQRRATSAGCVKFWDNRTGNTSKDINAIPPHPPFPPKKRLSGKGHQATKPYRLHSAINLVCIVRNLNLLYTKLFWHAAITGTDYPRFCPTQNSNRSVTTVHIPELIKITYISRKEMEMETYHWFLAWHHLQHAEQQHHIHAE